MQTTCVPESMRPKISFPAANYPLKIIGNNSSNYKAIVIKVMSELKINFNEESIKLVASNGDKFLSMRLTITAESEQQLKTLHEALLTKDEIIMVL